MSGINSLFHSEYKYISKEFKNIMYRKGKFQNYRNQDQYCYSFLGNYAL